MSANDNSMSNDLDVFVLRETADAYINRVTIDRSVVERVRDAFGSNGNLAVAMSGSADKKSKAYKSAIRTVQRIVAGKHKTLSAKNQEAIRTAALNGKHLPLPEQVNVTVTGEIGVSSDRRHRTVRLSLRGADRYTVLATARESAMDGYDALGGANGMPGMMVFGEPDITISGGAR